MDSSSDGSFAWTDASNDTIDSGAMVKDNITKTHSEDESISGKSYKRKLQEELFAKTNGEIKREDQLKPKERKRKLTEGHIDNEHVSPKKKKIKREPESDIDVLETKTNGNNHSVSDDCYYETYLDIKVKAEQELATPSLKKTKKIRSKSILQSDNLNDELLETEKKTPRKKSNHSFEETDIKDNNLNQLAEDENENLKKKRKKKKKTSKTRKDSLMSDETNHLDSHMDVSEAIEESSCRSPNQSSVPGANVTSHLEAIEPESKNINNKFYIEDPENSRNGETATGKNPPDLPFNKSVTFDVHNAAVPRTPRISERIQFEEDDSSEMETSQLQSSKTSIESSKLKTYLKNNLNLKPLSSKLQTESVLSVDDEIWIVRCPKVVDIDAFQNKNLTLEGKCKLKLNGETYEGTVDNEIENMSILSSNHRNFIIQSLPVKGFLNLRKRIPKCHMRDEVMVSQTANFIPLPETKCRHPLFGSNYRKAIKLPHAVAERLCTSSSLMRSTDKPVHAKKKKSHKIDHPLSTPKLENNVELSVKTDVKNDQSVSCKKKKKKQRHLESEDIAPKKKKRLKYDLESAEAWESEQAIEENLFNF